LVCEEYPHSLLPLGKREKWGLEENLRTRFILLAETNDALADIIRQEIATTDYALLHAKDGLEALNYLDLLKSDIDIVVIRADLPVVSGLHVIWRLVRRKQPKPPRIIATTQVEDVPLLKHVVKELGSDAEFCAPTSLEDLRQVVRRVLNSRSIGKRSSATAGT
jgi:DNA-binding response OmpR family regulator